MTACDAHRARKNGARAMSPLGPLKVFFGSYYRLTKAGSVHPSSRFLDHPEGRVI